MMAERSVIHFGKKCNQNGYDSDKTVLLKRMSKNYLHGSLVNSVSFIKEACCLRCHWNSLKNNKQSHPHRKNRTSWSGDWLLFLTLTMKYDYKPCGLIMKLKKKNNPRWTAGLLLWPEPSLAPLMSVSSGLPAPSSRVDGWIHSLPALIMAVRLLVAGTEHSNPCGPLRATASIQRLDHSELIVALMAVALKTRSH